MKVYCLIKGDLKNYKRMRRKYKNHVNYVRNGKSYEETFKEIINQNNETDIGIICDNMYILPNNNLIYKFPRDWQVLFNQYDIDKYNFENVENNMYWVSSKVLSSYNFIINKSIIYNVREWLNKQKHLDWKSIIAHLNTYNTYIMTQYIQSDTRARLNGLEELKLDNANNTLNINKYEYLPSISLIYPIQDQNNIATVIYTFFKLNYPRDKLELVILDSLDSDKYFKGIIPQDSRIQIIKLDNKKGDIPLGWMLNTGVKYSKKDICGLLLDTCYYSFDYIKTMVNNLLEGDNLEIITNGDLSHLLFTKNAWKTYSFNESGDKLLYYFLYNRQNITRKCETKPYSEELNKFSIEE